MNKFTAFKKAEEYSGFDFMLWLDADVVVFDDPSNYLTKDHLRCTPAMYNYLIRFPGVNETALLWNGELPHFQLHGLSEIVPHGVCNTGK